MDPRTRDYQQMAIGILAIATAAMGFALWQQDFDLTYPSGHSAEIVIAYWVAIVAPFVAAIFYFLTFITVGEVLGRESGVTGLEVVRSSVVWLYLQMLTLSIMFFVNYLSELILAIASAGTMP